MPFNTLTVHVVEGELSSLTTWIKNAYINLNGEMLYYSFKDVNMTQLYAKLLKQFVL